MSTKQVKKVKIELTEEEIALMFYPLINNDVGGSESTVGQALIDKLNEALKKVRE